MPPVRWFSTIFIALLTAFSLCGGALAQASNTYTVTGVDVDLSAPDAVQARQHGIEFVRERSAPGRYIATLNVVFQPDSVKAWLGQAGVKIAETVSRAALVIPLWKGKAGVEPLDDRNAL